MKEGGERGERKRGLRWEGLGRRVRRRQTEDKEDGRKGRKRDKEGRRKVMKRGIKNGHHTLCVGGVCTCICMHKL